MPDGIYGFMAYASNEIDKFFREHKEEIEKLNDELLDAMYQDVAKIIARRILNERRMHTTKAGRVSRLCDDGIEQPGRAGD